MLPTFLKQILKVRSGGFTIMELMVGAGLTGLVSLAIMQLFGQTAKLQQESQVRSELMQLRLLTKTILSDKDNCDATVMPNIITPILKTTPATIIPPANYINLPNGIKRRFTRKDEDTGVITITDEVAINSGSRFGGRLEILGIELIEYNPRTSSKINAANNRILDTGVLEVRIRVNRKVYRPTATGGQTLVDNPVSIETPIIVSLDSTNAITGCVYNSNLTPQRITDEACVKFLHRGDLDDPLTERSITTTDVCSIAPTVAGQTRIQAHRERAIREELCRSLRGTFGNDGVCRHPWANFTCPNGYVISGFPEQGSGDFHCTRIPTIPDCSLTPNPTTPQITSRTTTGTQTILNYTCVTTPP